MTDPKILGGNRVNRIRKVQIWAPVIKFEPELFGSVILSALFNIFVPHRRQQKWVIRNKAREFEGRSGVVWPSYGRVKALAGGILLGPIGKIKNFHYMSSKPHTKTPFLTQDIPSKRLVTFDKKYLQISSRSQNMKPSGQIVSDSFCYSL